MSVDYYSIPYATNLCTKCSLPLNADGIAHLKVEETAESISQFIHPIHRECFFEAMQQQVKDNHKIHCPYTDCSTQINLKSLFIVKPALKQATLMNDPIVSADPNISIVPIVHMQCDGKEPAVEDVDVKSVESLQEKVDLALVNTKMVLMEVVKGIGLGIASGTIMGALGQGSLIGALEGAVIGAASLGTQLGINAARESKLTKEEFLVSSPIVGRACAAEMGKAVDKASEKTIILSNAAKKQTLAGARKIKDITTAVVGAIKGKKETGLGFSDDYSVFINNKVSKVTKISGKALLSGALSGISSYLIARQFSSVSPMTAYLSGAMIPIAVGVFRSQRNFYNIRYDEDLIYLYAPIGELAGIFVASVVGGLIGGLSENLEHSVMGQIASMGGLGIITQGACVVLPVVAWESGKSLWGYAVRKLGRPAPVI